MAGKKNESDRELISPNGDNRYVRRGENGQFSESDDQGRSLGSDVKQHSKKEVSSGHGDEGDRQRRSKK